MLKPVVNTSQILYVDRAERAVWPRKPNPTVSLDVGQRYQMYTVMILLQPLPPPLLLLKEKNMRRTDCNFLFTLAKSSLTPQFSFALVSHRIPPTSDAKCSALARETTLLLSMSVLYVGVFCEAGKGRGKEGQACVLVCLCVLVCVRVRATHLVFFLSHMRGQDRSFTQA